MYRMLNRKTIWPAFSLVAALAVLTIGASVTRAQSAQLKIEGQPFVLNEFGAVIGEHDGTLEIDMVVIEPENRDAAYREIDLKAQDQILMFNGKRVKSTAEFEAAYNALKPGDDVTLAIKRERHRMMVSFPKGKPNARGPRIMVRTAPQGEAGDVTPILGLGILVSETEGKVEVVDALPTPPGVEIKQVFEKGDIIVKLQDKPVVSIADLETRFGKIAVGDEVSFEVTRDGGKDVFTIAKPDAPQGRVTIKKQ